MSKQKTVTEKENLGDSAFKNHPSPAERLQVAIQRDWASRLNKNQLEVFNHLFGTLATLFEQLDSEIEDGVSEMRAEYRKNPVARYLRTLNTWLEKSVSELKYDSEIATDLPKELVEKLQNLTIAESQRLESSKYQDKKKRKNFEGSSQLPEGVTDLKRIEKLTATLRDPIVLLQGELKQLKTEVHALSKTGHEASFELQMLVKSLLLQQQKTGTEIVRLLNALTEHMTKLQDFSSGHNATSNEILLKLKNIEQSEKTKIHLRDSIQVLEIRRDVERFVAEDLLHKVSRAIMPHIQAMRDLDKSQLESAIKSLEEKCNAAGLYSVDTLYR